MIAWVDAAYLRLAHQYLRAGSKAELTVLKEARASLRCALQQEDGDRAQEQAIAQATSSTEQLRQDLVALGWEAQVGSKGRSLYVALKADQVPHPAIAGAKVYALAADRVATAPELARRQRLQVWRVPLITTCFPFKTAGAICSSFLACCCWGWG